MSNNNIIQIKRRLTGLSGAPVSLSAGELAFNEVDLSLYYGSQYGVIPIGGYGSFLALTGTQTANGDKTFTGSTTLSSTTFSLNSVIDANYNKIINLSEPTLSADAATKNYVDSSQTNLSSWVDQNFVEKNGETDHVYLSGGLDVVSGLIADNVTITGNLSVLGTQVVVNTETINISGTSTQIDVINNGTGTGITVNQIGSEDIAVFQDDGDTVLAIQDGGKVSIGTGNNVDYTLTVKGTISASDAVVFGSTLAVSGLAEFNNDAKVVNTLNVVGPAWTSSSSGGLDGGGISIAGTDTPSITLNDSDFNQVTIDINGINTGLRYNNLPFEISTIFDLNLYSDTAVKIKACDNSGTYGAVFISASATNFDQGDLIGNGTNRIDNFILDGGSF